MNRNTLYVLKDFNIIWADDLLEVAHSHTVVVDGKGFVALWPTKSINGDTCDWSEIERALQLFTATAIDFVTVEHGRDQSDPITLTGADFDYIEIKDEIDTYLERYQPNQMSVHQFGTSDIQCWDIPDRCTLLMVKRLFSERFVNSTINIESMIEKGNTISVVISVVGATTLQFMAVWSE